MKSQDEQGMQRGCSSMVYG